MVTQIIQKQFFCVTDVCVCVCARDRKISSQTTNVCNWRVHSKYPMKARELHKRIPARKPCVTDVLCNLDIIPK